MAVPNDIRVYMYIIIYLGILFGTYGNIFAELGFSFRIRVTRKMKENEKNLTNCGRNEVANRMRKRCGAVRWPKIQNGQFFSQ